MPLRERPAWARDLKAYVDAPDEAARSQIVSDHLARMETQLSRTQDAVASLRALLSTASPVPHITIRTVPAVSALAIDGTVALAGLLDWWQAATRELDSVLRAGGMTAAGPLEAMFDHAVFADETYAALGRYVAERGIGTDGPVRERYLAGTLDDPAPLVTEIAWPVRRGSRSVRTSSTG